MRVRLFALVGILGLAGAGVWGTTPDQLAKLHILMVIDTAASDLTRSVTLDEKRMLRLWRETIPESMRTLTILKGEKATRKAILAHYHDLRVQPDEGVLFYYAGHGTRDKKSGKHLLDLSQGLPLSREDLVRAIEAKRPALAVVLTDCCSTPGKLTEPLTQARAVVIPAKTLHPTLKCLLFQTRGTVDVTAATDNASWSDNLEGGLFTRSLCRLLKQTIRVMDTNRDGFVSWREFYPQLRDETKSLFADWRKEVRTRGDRISERSQVPHAFALGRLIAAVGIENGTRERLTYQYRWTGESTWREGTLSAGQVRIHSRSVKEPDTPLPILEARFDGVRETQRLTACEWAGSKEPGKLPRHYRIRAKRSGDKP
jgi:hypothetical protein